MFGGDSIGLETNGKVSSVKAGMIFMTLKTILLEKNKQEQKDTLARVAQEMSEEWNDDDEEAPKTLYKDRESFFAAEDKQSDIVILIPETRDDCLVKSKERGWISIRET
jgi:hypothetical protein